MNSTWLITSELANQHARKALFTCVVYTNLGYCTIKHGRIYVAFVSALNAVSYKSLSLIYMKINLQMKHSFITRVIHTKTCFDTGKDNSEMAYGNG